MLRQFEQIPNVVHCICSCVVWRIRLKSTDSGQISKCFISMQWIPCRCNYKPKIWHPFCSVSHWLYCVTYVDCENACFHLWYPNKRCAKHSSEFKRCEIANSHLISTISVRCFRLTTKHIQNRHTQFIWFTKFVGSCPIFGTPFVLFTCQKKDSFCFWRYSLAE